MPLQMSRNCLKALLDGMNVSKMCFKYFIMNSSFFASSFNIVLASTLEYQLLKILQGAMLKPVV